MEKTGVVTGSNLSTWWYLEAHGVVKSTLGCVWGCLLAALRREGCRDVDGTIPQTVGLHTVQVDKGESQGTMPGALPLYLDLHHHGLKPL